MNDPLSMVTAMGNAECRRRRLMPVVARRRYPERRR